MPVNIKLEQELVSKYTIIYSGDSLERTENFVIVQHNIADTYNEGKYLDYYAYVNYEYSGDGNVPGAAIHSEDNRVIIKTRYDITSVIINFAIVKQVEDGK